MCGALGALIRFIATYSLSVTTGAVFKTVDKKLSERRIDGIDMQLLLIYHT